jgi:CDP-glycerol glycerophosphotransferase (TagB/SpsB family)
MEHEFAARERKRDFLYFHFWPWCYRFFSKRPVQKKLAVFANDCVRSLPDNMQCLYDELRRRGYRCILCLKPKHAGNPISAQVHSFCNYLRFIYYYAHCRCVFLSDYYFPVYSVKPREGTRVIQLWHACGAFKKWGYSTLGNAWGDKKGRMIERYPIHNTYTDVPVSAEKVIPYYADAFHCDQSLIKPLGVARTDRYFDHDFIAQARSRVLASFPEIGERKILLYAPTFRGTSMYDAHNDVLPDYSVMREALGEKYVILNKLHPFVEQNKAQTPSVADSFVFTAKDLPIDVCLCAADLLISDYSSLIFEYALLERPMVFFAYDLDTYDEERGFYQPYRSFVPGPIAANTSELISAVQRVDGKCSAQVLKFKEDYMSACDGHAVERLLGLIS